MLYKESLLCFEKLFLMLLQDLVGNNEYLLFKSKQIELFDRNLFKSNDCVFNGSENFLKNTPKLDILFLRFGKKFIDSAVCTLISAASKSTDISF
jgi:hypothetical protein